MRKSLVWVLLCVVLLAGCRVIPEEVPVPTEILHILPTLTPEPTFTPPPPPTPEPTPEPTIEVQAEVVAPLPAMRPFVILEDAPIITQAFLHQDLGCDWLGLGGQAFALDGMPQPGLVVVVVGNVAGQPVESLGFTGLAPGYGPAGYEVKLADAALPGIFWMQAFDLDGKPLTDSLNFTMTEGCAANLAIINFRQQDPTYILNLPLIGR